jgi:aspartyl-tRNA(Asn)/glutamyl-tRNA(Gln) amidotransferase subunit C
VSVTVEQVRHVSRLARLHLTAEEEARYATQLSAILEHVAQLNALDTTGVPPMTHASTEATLFRDDVPQPSLGGARAVANAPESIGTSVSVPRIIE